ncbi:MAG: IS66 family insertion sequence element accessory protein TnpB [Kofleriaceae bacterium]|nr:IS66 family insertion sequence element accessory protein TnpB [Kofleriaceae bacterium]
MQTEARARALFVFVGKRGQTMKVLTWDGTGTIVIHKKLDAGGSSCRGRRRRGAAPADQRRDVRRDPQGRRADAAHAATSPSLIETSRSGLRRRSGRVGRELCRRAPSNALRCRWR